MKVDRNRPPVRTERTEDKGTAPAPSAPAQGEATGAAGWAPQPGATSRSRESLPPVTTPTAPPTRFSAADDESIARAVKFGGRSVAMLPDKAYVDANPQQRTAMMKALLSDLVSPQNAEPGEAELLRAGVSELVANARTPSELDYMLTRVDAGAVMSNLSGATRMKALRNIEALHRPTPGDWAGYTKYLEEVTGAKPSGTNQLEFLVDGTEVSPRGLELINGAKDSINLSVFQLQGDEVGGKVVDALCEKAKAGVKVRVLLDEFGSTSEPDGVKVKEYVDKLRASGAEVIVNDSPLLKDHLDHRKVLVVDGQGAFTGGMNIGNHYQRQWHDQQTLVRGPAVNELQQAFFEHWGREGGKVPEGAERERYFPPQTEVPDGSHTWVVKHEGNKQDRNIKAAYLKAIGTAEKSITLANPYFADEDVIKSLCNAARRGVKVQVVLPRENDMGIVKRAATAYYPDLIKAGAEVYEYPDRMAHQKVAVIDGKWATVGSSNLDARSLEFNDEMNLVVLDEKFASDIQRKMFDVDVAKSTRITHADPTLRERLDRLISGLL